MENINIFGIFLKYGGQNGNTGPPIARVTGVKIGVRVRQFYVKIRLKFIPVIMLI